MDLAMMLDTLVEYWFVVLSLIVLTISVAAMVLNFAGLPTKRQLEKVKEWLLYAVTLAETELGSGTGQLKLRTVYDMFLERFSWLSKFISFEKFSDLVDEALVEMREMLEKNENVRTIVGVDSNE
jgi:hypothetical protein